MVRLVRGDEDPLADPGLWDRGLGSWGEEGRGWRSIEWGRIVR